MNDAVSWMRILVGAALATAFAVEAMRAKALTRSGAVAAALMGTLAVAAGWSWGFLLATYFIGASAVSYHRAEDKRTRAGDLTEKAGPRDAIQVVANGAVFAIAASAYLVSPERMWQAIAAAALAASAADTWATEIGVLSAAPPRSIVTGRVVPAGTSGGVTMRGFAASAAGAAFVALMARLAGWPASPILSALIGGVAGSVIDSVIGATLQARRRCSFCAADTERRVHRCGRATERVGGVSLLDNDAVNALSTVGGALVGAAAGQLI